MPNPKTIKTPIEFAQTGELIEELGGRFQSYVFAGVLPRGADKQMAIFAHGDRMQMLGILQVVHARVMAEMLMTGGSDAVG